MLVRIARRYLGDWAEDAVQDALLAVWLRYGEAGLADPRLLTRAVKRRALDLAERERRHARLTVPLEPWHSEPEDVEARAIQQLEVEEAVRLADACRPDGWSVSLLVLSALGYTDREVAQAAGLPVATVKSARWRERQCVLARKRSER